MNRRDYDSVVEHCRLVDGAFFPTSITLDVPQSFESTLDVGDRMALRDPEGVMLAALSVEHVWSDDAEEDEERRQWHIAGEVEGLQLPVHYDFTHLRLTPSELRDDFARRGWSTIAAWQPPSGGRPASLERVFAGASDLHAGLLIHVTTGAVRPGDVPHYSRVRAYEAAVRSHPAASARLALLPLGFEPIGARGALLRALVARNCGCTHLLVDGEVPEEVRASARDLGLIVVSLPGADSQIASGDRVGVPAQPLRSRQGFTVFFTGLSGSGKSTIANALLVKLLEMGGRQVTLLDGDVVRKHLSSELGFSKEHRDLNVRRIGYVASEITKHGGIAICAPIAPYDAVRKDVRQMIEPHGGFVLVHVATPLEVCEGRDRKGLYAKARAGTLQQFTGISDPYETPADAPIVIDTERTSVDEASTAIVDYLRREGYLAG